MTVIQRFKVVTEVVELPEGHLICSKCKGRGMLSKYDEGIKSLVYDPALAALHTCDTCQGEGYVKCLI